MKKVEGDIDMANTIDFILTNAAEELTAKVMNGKTLNFIRMAIGDGFSYDTTVAKGYKTLVHEVLSLNITKKEVLNAESVKITSAFTSTDANAEFYYREVGLFAEDPDTKEEVLYAYGNRNDAAELITPAGNNIVSKQLMFIVTVGDSANVTFNVNQGIYALQSDMVDVQQNKANKDLVNTGMITNCLLEVPQDIKLELSNGVLTLKAGSKVYRPNGVGIFDEVIINSDIKRSDFDTSSNKILLFYNVTTKIIGWYTLGSNIYSGNTAPINPTMQGVWYDTANNIIKNTADGGVTWVATALTLPIAIVTRVNGVVTSIDQVFNGMGYMGSTVFALPGIKGVVPNGRFNDGTFMNIVTTLNNVYTYTFASDFFSGNYVTSLIDNFGSGFTGLELKAERSIRIQNETPTEINIWWYHPEANQWKYCDRDLVMTKRWWLDFGVCNVSERKILSFNPKYVNRLIDYNDYERKISELEARLTALENV